MRHQAKQQNDTMYKHHQAKSKVAQNLKTSKQVKAQVVKQKLDEYMGRKFTPITQVRAGDKNVLLGYQSGNYGDHRPTTQTAHLWSKVAKETSRTRSAMRKQKTVAADAVIELQEKNIQPLRPKSASRNSNIKNI